MWGDTERRVDVEAHAAKAHEEAVKAANNFVRAQAVKNPAAWDRNTWRLFIWRVLNAGLHAYIDETENAYKQKLKELDEIPY